MRNDCANASSGAPSSATTPHTGHHVIPKGGEMEASPDDRKCTHVREDGTRCKGWRMKDHPAGLCAGHAGIGVAADPAEAARLSAESRREQAETRTEARKRTLKDMLAERLEEQADAIATRLTAIIANGDDSDALRAIENWMSRVYGRPTERVEATVVEPESVAELRRMSSEERRALLARMAGDGRLSLVRTGTED